MESNLHSLCIYRHLVPVLKYEKSFIPFVKGGIRETIIHYIILYLFDGCVRSYGDLSVEWASTISVQVCSV